MDDDIIDNEEMIPEDINININGINSSQAERMMGRMEAAIKIHAKMQSILSNLKNELQTIQSSIEKHEIKSKENQQNYTEKLISELDRLDEKIGLYTSGRDQSHQNVIRQMCSEVYKIEGNILHDIEQNFYHSDGKFFKSFDENLSRKIDDIKSDIENLKGTVEQVLSVTTRKKTILEWFKNIATWIIIASIVLWQLSQALAQFGLLKIP